MIPLLVLIKACGLEGMISLDASSMKGILGVQMYHCLFNPGGGCKFSIGQCNGLEGKVGQNYFLEYLDLTHIIINLA